MISSTFPPPTAHPSPLTDTFRYVKCGVLWGFLASALELSRHHMMQKIMDRQNYDYFNSKWLAPHSLRDPGHPPRQFRRHRGGKQSAHGVLNHQPYQVLILIKICKIKPTSCFSALSRATLYNTLCSLNPNIRGLHSLTPSSTTSSLHPSFRPSGPSNALSAKLYLKNSSRNMTLFSLAFSSLIQ